MKSLQILIVLITLISCTSSKKMIKESNFKIEEFSVVSFNGCYSNNFEKYQSTEFELTNSKTLWEILYSSYKFPDYLHKKDTLIIPENSIVKIELVDDKNITVKLISNKKLLREINLKGKIKSNYFLPKPNFFLIPIPVLCMKRSV